MQIWMVNKRREDGSWETIGVGSSQVNAEAIRYQYFGITSRYEDFIQIVETSTECLWNY